MNKIKRLWLLAIMMCTTLGTSAHDFEVDGIYYNITSSNSPYTVAVTYRGYYYFSYSDRYTGSVTIPESVTYDGTTYSVTRIDGGAFYGCSGLTSITIPNSVTSIGKGAFLGTAWYDNQPDGLVYAGKFAYNYKGTMPEGTSIVLEESTLGIADGAFYECNNLTSITIPNSVTRIGDNAFDGCYGLTSVTIGNSVTSIGERAFEYCYCLSSVVIPNSVTSIGNFTFYGCIGLTSVTIGNSVTNIGERAFGECTGLTSVTIPNSVTSIGYEAFSSCI